MIKKIMLLLIAGLFIAFFVECKSDIKTISTPDNINLEEYQILKVDLDELLIAKNQVVYWNSKTGKIIEKIDNIFMRCIEIPINSTYVGYSFNAGYLFQLGNKLYSIFPANQHEDFILISKKVIEVIDCNDSLDPVFLMKNGSLKKYIINEKKLVDID